MTCIAVFGDVHGNLVALDAVLNDIERQGADQLVCLGDVAGSGPQPAKVLDRLRALACPVAMGNVDAWLLEPTPLESESAFHKRVWELDSWCLAQLGPEHLDFVRTFEKTVTLTSGSVSVLCCHGSPRSYHDPIAATTPDETVAAWLENAGAAVVLTGHTHQTMVRRFQETLLVNPGSVGLPYERMTDGTVRNPPWAEYALVTVQKEAVNVCLKRVPIERERVIEAIVSSGMPHADLWAQGWRQ